VHSFRCAQCGAEHSGVPLVWGPDAPSALRAIPQADWPKRVSLSQDDCVIDRTTYLVRGCLDIPIRGSHDVFRWLVWVRVGPEGYRYTMSPWRRLFRLRHPPYVAALDTALPYAPPTQGLPLEVRSAGPGYRPQVHVTDGRHPLGAEQREGIPLERAYELAGMMLHAWESRGA
jgi:hypothetical protein